jgi:NAD(P)H-flavin reductase
VLSDPPETWHGETGFIDAALINRIFSDQELHDWVFVICGPAIMMDTVEDHLIEKGTPSHRILTERFDYD